MTVPVNLTSAKFCAFCKYWWDPTYKFIEPNVRQMWYYDPSGKCRCIKKGLDTPANHTCQNFKCRVDW